MEERGLEKWGGEREILLPLELCMKLIGLEEKPQNPADRQLFQKTVTEQAHRYGLYKVKKYRQRLLDEWELLQSLL